MKRFTMLLADSQSQLFPALFALVVVLFGTSMHWRQLITLLQTIIRVQLLFGGQILMELDHTPAILQLLVMFCYSEWESQQ